MLQWKKKMKLLIGIFLWHSFKFISLTSSSDESDHVNDYCVIGAGPSGLQMGYFLQKAGRDYIIYEKASTVGSFFIQYPRHRKLISINKIYTGRTNKEFNFRHDWNSLISDDEDLLIGRYTEDFFPHADVMVKYLSDYAQRYRLNIQYNTDVKNIKRIDDEYSDVSRKFELINQVNTTYTCRTVIVCTGISKPNRPEFDGSEHTVGYEDVSLNRTDFIGKSVLILGKGNSAMETAMHIGGVADFIHLVSGSFTEEAYYTHYVGDIRAVNNEIYDTFFLKSLDGLLTFPLDDDLTVTKDEDGKFHVDGAHAITLRDNFLLRHPYDVIIRCLGFLFDFSIFDESSLGLQSVTPKKSYHLPKYPLINHDFQAHNVPGLYFAGTNTHSLDQKKSSGGFIHGFRYTARVLHRILEHRNHGEPWPSIRQPITELLNHLVKRINEASGLYQMFGVLGDVISLSRDGTSYEYFEEYPVKLLWDFKNITGQTADSVIVVLLEYGKDDEVHELGLSKLGHKSYFIHPVLYYYDKLPTESYMNETDDVFDVLPRPSKIHHMNSDFLTSWKSPNSHVLPLRRFIENILERDLRYFYDDQCFRFAMTRGEVPSTCQDFYQRGIGIPGQKIGKILYL
ncbi:FAD-dependent oxidoreductase domain-containing protein 2-like [Glandiceps talaboti]